MTDIDRTDPLAPMLPGLGDGPRRTGQMVRAVRATFGALYEQQLLKPEHAGLMELALQLAQAVEAASAARRGTAVAMAARELREVLDALPKPAEGGDDDWQKFAAEFASAAS